MRKFLRCAARLAMGAALAFALAGVLAAAAQAQMENSSRRERCRSKAV